VLYTETLSVTEIPVKISVDIVIFNLVFGLSEQQGWKEACELDGNTIFLNIVLSLSLHGCYFDPLPSSLGVRT
jgi:hypothetical protein